MCYTIETIYDQRAMTAMVRGLRKTIRRKRSRRRHGFGWFAAALGTIFVFSATENTGKLMLTSAVVVLMVAVLLFEDPINAYIAGKRGLPGLEQVTTTFYEDGFPSVTAMGDSEFRYDRILRLVRVGHYLVFVLGPNHGQVYDLRTLSGGTEEEFLDFLVQNTQKRLETA